MEEPVDEGDRGTNSLEEEYKDVGFTRLRGNTVASKCAYLMKVVWSICTMRFLGAEMARSVEDPDEMYDALQSQWATVALMDGLLLSILGSYPTVDVDSMSSDMHPESNHCADMSTDNFDCRDIYGLVFFYCNALFLWSLIIIVMEIIMLNTVPKRMCVLYIREFMWVIGFPELLMVFGTILCAFLIFMYTYLTYSGNVFPATSAITAFILVFNMYLMGHLVVVLDKPGGLWEHAAAQNRSLTITVCDC